MVLSCHLEFLPNPDSLQLFFILTLLFYLNKRTLAVEGLFFFVLVFDFVGRRITLLKLDIPENEMNFC